MITDIKEFKRIQALERCFASGDDSRPRIYKCGSVCISETDFNLYYTDGHRMAVLWWGVGGYKPAQYKVCVQKNKSKVVNSLFKQNKEGLFVHTGEGAILVSMSNEAYMHPEALRNILPKDKPICTWSMTSNTIYNLKKTLKIMSLGFGKTRFPGIECSVLKKGISIGSNKFDDGLRISGNFSISDPKGVNPQTIFKINSTYLYDAVRFAPDHSAVKFSYYIDTLKVCYDNITIITMLMKMEET